MAGTEAKEITAELRSTMINNACNDDIDTFELGKRVREWGNALTHQVNGEKQELAKQRSQLESEKVVF